MPRQLHVVASTPQPRQGRTGGLLMAWQKLLSLLASIRVTRRQRALQVLATQTLGDRRMLTVVEWKGRELLLGVTPQEIALLATAPCENLETRP